jgi:gliding motility-associated-like protein
MKRFSVIIALASIVLRANSQTSTLAPVLVSSGGGYTSTPQMSLSFSIGEAITETKGPVSGLILTQGFQQPTDAAIPKAIDTTAAPIVYNGFSPNSDGQNDTWIIDFITNYPNNTVTIFNRWGNKVWYGEGYNNSNVVWDGTDSKNKKALPAGTYFYVVTKDGKTAASKGWVEITKK